MHPALSLALFAALSVPAIARQPAIDLGASAPAGAIHETDHLTIRTSIDRAGAGAPGARITLVIEVTPKPRMHVYAPAQQDYIPVSLALDKSDAFTAQAAVFPAAEKYFFKPLAETQLVYSKPFRIRQEITLAARPGRREPGQPDGSVTVSGTLRYQACDDTICYMPKTVPVRWIVGLKPQR